MKKGKMAWEYLAAIVLSLLVLVILMIFSKAIKDKIVEAFRNLIEVIIGR